MGYPARLAVNFRIDDFTRTQIATIAEGRPTLIPTPNAILSLVESPVPAPVPPSLLELGRGVVCALAELGPNAVVSKLVAAVLVVKSGVDVVVTRRVDDQAGTV